MIDYLSHALAAGRVGVPVVWQLTRTELEGTSRNTITESYRETWYVSTLASGVLTLSSHHATVSVASTQSDNSRVGLPELLFISEYDLAQLAGVSSQLEATRGSQDKVDRARSNMVAISMSVVPGKRLTTATWQWSDDMHVSITLEMGQVRAI